MTPDGGPITGLPVPPDEPLEPTDDEQPLVGVYREWCRDPTMCAHRGYCPRDPACDE